YLHTDGGSLIGGMDLGRVLRDHGLQTFVGRKGQRNEHFTESVAGHCMSAAAIAFLGGEFRFVGEKNKFGVHRFTVGDEGTVAVNNAQILSASVIEYIKSMEVSTELFSLASEVDASDILVIPEETLLRLNIVNNGIKPPKWSIEALPDGLYLRGEQETVFGYNKFIVAFPPDDRPFFHFVVGLGKNANDAINMPTDRMVLDREYVEMYDLRIERFNNEGYVNAIYAAEDRLLDQLVTAKRVGICFQWSSEGAVFLGFDNMPFEEGAEKLKGLLAMYRGKQGPQPVGTDHQS
ncbi:MAG: periplasmic protein-like protein, partial [Xanthobacteraceae bacterium]|nr:periplasmic protein-like protein [Xanthobacteraceae bacterium]